jgi:hypothetical protein
MSDLETAAEAGDCQMVGCGGITLNVVVYVWWSPASTSAVTTEDPAAHEEPAN